MWTDESMFNRPDVWGFALSSTDTLVTLKNPHAWVLVRHCSHGYRLRSLYAHNTESAKVVLTATTNVADPVDIKAVPLDTEPMIDWSEDKITEQASLIAEA